MALKTRVKRLEERHGGTMGLAVIMRPGETPDDAVTRTLSERNMPRQARIIVVPAKNVAKPKGAAA